METIYGLFDPETSALRYVGRTANRLPQRLSQHLAPSSLCRRPTHKTNWIRTVLARGFRPEIGVLEVVPLGQGIEAESFWISYFKYIGADLTNSTADGRGQIPGQGVGKIVSAETRAKMSVAHRGKKYARHGADAVLANSRRQGGSALRDQFGNVYATVAEAARSVGTSRSGVQRILNGSRRSIKGYSFSRVKEKV